jgi:hypothetical protein
MEPGIQRSVILAGEYYPFLMYDRGTALLFVHKNTAWYRSGATRTSENAYFYEVAA